MDSLYETCVQFTTLVLQPSDIILHGGGFVLRRDLAIRLADVVSDMDHLLHLASAQRKLSTPPFIGQMELMVLTFNAGFTVPATQNQIVWNWIVIIDKLYVAMKDLRSLYKGRPVYILGCEQPSMMPRILASLTPSLLVKLPADFLQAYGISVSQPVRETARQTTGARERERASLHLHGSRAPLPHIEAGGPVNLQTTAGDGAPCTTDSVSPSAMETAAADAPPIHSVAAAPAIPATSPSRTSMVDLVPKYRAGPDSVSQRATNIVEKSSLDSEDISDCGECNGSPYTGRFGLESSLFIRVDETVMEIQALLTKASSLAGRASYFIIDPHHILIDMLRGPSGVAELQCAWDCLAERLRIAHSILDLYQQGCTNPEREACDAAAQRRVEDTARRARQTSEAQKRRGPPDNAQAATGRNSPPVTSLPLAAACAPITAGSPQPPSHPMENGLRIGEHAKATEHAPTVAATPAAVKDPTYELSCASLHASGCRAAAARTSSGTLEPARAAAVRPLDTHLLERVPAAVKDPPLARVVDGVDSLAPPRGFDGVVVEHGGLKSTHEQCVASKGEEARTLHLLACTSSATRLATVDSQVSDAARAPRYDEPREAAHVPAMAATPAAVKDPPRKDVAAKVEGLEPNARGIVKYLPGPRGIELLTASSLERSLEKPFVAEVTQFPAPSHVLEDVIVELGGLSITDATPAVDPLGLENAINQQRIALKEDARTSDSCARSSFLLQAPSPAATLQSPPFVVDETACVVSECTETNLIQHGGLLRTTQLSSNALIWPRMDKDHVQYAPKAAIPAALKDPPCDSQCAMLFASARKSDGPAAAENEGGRGRDMNEDLCERGSFLRNCAPEFQRRKPAQVASEALLKDPVSDLVARFEAMAHISSASRSMPTTCASREAGEPASTSTTEASDIRTLSSSATRTSRGASALPSASTGTATGEQSPTSDLELQKIGINLEAEFGQGKEQSERIFIGSAEHKVLLPPPALDLAYGERAVEPGERIAGQQSFLPNAGPRTFAELKSGSIRGPACSSTVTCRVPLHQPSVFSSITTSTASTLLSSSSPASTTSAPSRASAPVTGTLRVVLADTWLRKLVLAPSRNVLTEDEHGGQKSIVSRAGQQNSNSEGEGRTLRMLEKTSSCEVRPPPHFCPDAVRCLEITRPMYAHLDAAFVPARRLVTFMATAYLDFVLVSTILRTRKVQYLEHHGIDDAAPSLVWAREGIGTTLRPLGFSVQASLRFAEPIGCWGSPRTPAPDLAESEERKTPIILMLLILLLPRFFDGFTAPNDTAYHRGAIWGSSTLATQHDGSADATERSATQASRMGLGSVEERGTSTGVLNHKAIAFDHLNPRRHQQRSGQLRVILHRVGTTLTAACQRLWSTLALRWSKATHKREASLGVQSCARRAFTAAGDLNLHPRAPTTHPVARLPGATPRFRYDKPSLWQAGALSARFDATRNLAGIPVADQALLLRLCSPRFKLCSYSPTGAAHSVLSIVLALPASARVPGRSERTVRLSAALISHHHCPQRGTIPLLCASTCGDRIFNGTVDISSHTTWSSQPRLGVCYRRWLDNNVATTSCPCTDTVVPASPHLLR
ncbi:hypothetical protein B0H14DRAFT_3535081 [Mycena olivaceomarginata]|nr:hypothetical protein B0H14DRAFT_3535081 [Mycena olivaceomarginata]